MEDTKAISKRDESLDHLRGFAMLWVIIIHALYWGGYFQNIQSEL